MKRVTFAIWLFSLMFCAVQIAAAASVSGVVYHDGNHNSQSQFEQSLDDQDVLLSDITVNLLDGVDEIFTVTGDNGAYSFDDVEPGTYLVEVEMDNQYKCTTKNHPLRTPEAIREGAIHIVTIGDSIGAYGSDVLYPERLAEHFAGITDTTFNNQAVGGSTTIDWLPGSGGLFEERLVPALPDADVLTMTIGGNDLNAYVYGMPPYDIWQIILNFIDHPEYLLNILPNITTIIEAAREINPDFDFVFVLYPNFANSQTWNDLLGDLVHPIAIFGVHAGLGICRWWVGGSDDIVITDMMAAHGDEMLDPYLLDEIHPNDAGHQKYADFIFQTLGGVIVEADDMGTERDYGFYAPELVPVDDDTVDDDSIDDDTFDDDTVDDDTVDDDTVDDDVADDDVADDDIADDDVTDDDVADDDVTDDDIADDDVADDDDDDNDDGCGG